MGPDGPRDGQTGRRTKDRETNRRTDMTKLSEDFLAILRKHIRSAILA